MPATNGSTASYDAIVVGAGLSGLYAAKCLRDAGRSALVLEAQDRVGGRVLSQEHEGRRYDLGAQWIGPRHERMHRLVEEYRIPTFPTYTTGKKVLELNGNTSHYESSLPSMSLLKLLEMQVAMSRVEFLSRSIDPANPGAVPKADAWDAWTVDEWKRRTILTREVRGLIDVVTRVILGAEPREVSMLYFLSYLSSGGGLSCHVEAENGAQQTRFRDGAQSVPNALAEDLEEIVRTGAAVTAIETSESEVAVHAEGHTYRAQRVIFALAPAAMRGIDFRPALPAKRRLLLEKMPMGVTVKCMAFYEKPFWREDGYSGEAVSDAGPVSVVYDNSPEDGSVGCLLGFVVGGDGYAWGDLTARQRRKAALECFTEHFGPKASEATGYLEKNWAEDPWAKGCPVGVFAPGAMLTIAPGLREPHGRLHWAGTETALEWNGYMEGACEAGERTATEILEAIASTSEAAAEA